MLKMLVTLLILSLSSTITSSLNACENCIPITHCVSASQLVARDRSEKTGQILRKNICGFDSRVSLPKICCNNINQSIDNQETGEGTTSKLSNHHNVNLLPTQCGHIVTQRLLGGYRVWDNEFPWVVRIAYRNRDSNAFQCMGTLINSRYVLTTADCLIGRRILGVRVGGRIQSPECTNICESDVQDIGVSEQITHPEYTSSSRTLNNIGLLRLRNPVDLSKENAGVICLPVTDEHRLKNVTGSTGAVSYWDENGSELQFRYHATISTTEECDLYVNKNRNYRRDLAKNSICTVIVNNHRCESVPGAPLMLIGSDPDSYSYYQYGILNTAKSECGPEIYTDVRKYMTWILDTIKS
ncbi:PREDICTED: serine protease easter-like [Papilio polytes]|uniref:serine protease easter-like n=1 Tax=Papilio polytes TaxID=76194 RepID=UPI000676A9D5|nr:PREDICTED: serine protease easter-like [Papilio polytes]